MTVSTPIFASLNSKCGLFQGIIPGRVKWFDFLLDTDVNHQIYRHSEGGSASRPMFIRGVPLYGYLMTVSIPTLAYFIARCELFYID